MHTSFTSRLLAMTASLAISAIVMATAIVPGSPTLIV